VNALLQFSGVGRRFQHYGDISLAHGGAFTLIDDYGHHPVEMNATLAAARGAYPNRRLVLAFQPHRFTRTRDCFGEFVNVLRQFDAVVLTNVYPAGEARIAGADSKSLMKALGKSTSVQVVEDLQEIPLALSGLLKNGDVLITMGAGSISKLPQMLVEIGHV
jgi:UDP-N-acetylmuramate--alanine ligase